ncbi:Hsp20 family protein [Marinicellulosiphila megalodicopiae]|uniref:Hsp20 family protein n=1 Tax=Marinicellulosiphila megalodicopiae TaxID=2724896 RepID=UPI003BAFDDC5
MNSIDLSPLYRSSIGFDRLATLLDSAMASQDQSKDYPSYNIEMFDEHCYAITLAVAGFSQEDIDIQVNKGVLTISSNKPENKEGNFLHKGIANRAFERKFSLADYVEVIDADLSNGLLTINLIKEIPDSMKPKKITINANNQVLEHKGKQHAA